MITRENINELRRLTKAVDTAAETASELLRTAQDRFKMRTHKLKRDGKEIELTEKVLWEEVFYIGLKSEAGQLLQTFHPEVFEAYGAQDRAAVELKKFSIVELGFDCTRLTLSDYLEVTENLFELMLSERGFPTKSPLQDEPSNDTNLGSAYPPNKE